MLYKKTCLLFACFITILFTKAQPGAIDLSFDPLLGPNGFILTTAIQSDGKIIIGGDFTTYNGTVANHIARIESSGLLDTSFHTGSGFDNIVYTVGVQSDGRILVGGDFLTYQNDSTNDLARLNTDGSLDTAFHIGSNLNASVHDLRIQRDGKILIAGVFTYYGNIPRNRILRLYLDGSLDTLFNPFSGANGSIEKLCIQPDDKIVIGGAFTYYAGSPCLRVARLDTNGSLDTGFNPVIGGTNSNVRAIAIQPDGKILLGGDFTNYNGSVANRLVRVNSDGTIDYTFLLAQGANNEVNFINVDSAGRILVAGNFTSYNSISINRIILLNSDGTQDSTFFPGAGANYQIYSISSQANGKIIIGGTFDHYDSIVRNSIARLFYCLTPMPGTVTGIQTTLCAGAIQNYLVSDIPGADSYLWTVPAGWAGSSDSTFISSISNGLGGLISVAAYSDRCGYSLPRVDTITKILTALVPLCSVTVDTLSTHNIVIWDKPHTNLIDSFFIYREVTTNVYAKIASLPYDSLSEYHDYGANPNSTSYKYKISNLDICGTESGMSDYHNTIHLQNLGSGNLQWTFYQIENASNPVVSFNIYRDDLGNGHFTAIGLVPGTNATFTDINSFAFPNSIYVVDVNWGISCNPTRAVNTTRSNIKHKIYIDSTNVGIVFDAEQNFRIYPNPAIDIIYIDFSDSIYMQGIEVFDCLGQKVLCKEIDARSRNSLSVNIGAIGKGIYNINIATTKGRIIKKLVVE